MCVCVCVCVRVWPYSETPCPPEDPQQHDHLHKESLNAVFGLFFWVEMIRCICLCISYAVLCIIHTVT